MLFIEDSKTLLGGIQSKAETEDANLLLDIDSLIRAHIITPEQGVSLINCSNAVLEIHRMIIKAAKYLSVIGSGYEQLEQAVLKEEENLTKQISKAA